MMNVIFVLERVDPRNVSFSDFKLHCADKFLNKNRHEAPGLSDRLGRKKPPTIFAAVFHKTLDIAHLRVTVNFAALDLRKALLFRPLGDSGSCCTSSNSIIEWRGCYE